MPNYKKLVIREKAKLLLAAIETRDPAKIQAATVELLKAVDAAEDNNRMYCELLDDLQSAAKHELGMIEIHLRQLQTGWNPKLFAEILKAMSNLDSLSATIEREAAVFKNLELDEVYRGMLWIAPLKKAIEVVPVLKTGLQVRLQARQTGIGLTTAAVAKKKRVEEYIIRSRVLMRTAEGLRVKAEGDRRVLVKLEHEAEQLLQSAKAGYDRVCNLLKTNESRVLGRVLEAQKTKTAKVFQTVVLLVPVCLSDVKQCKGELKTLRIQLRELMKHALAVRPIPEDLKAAGLCLDKTRLELTEFEKEVLRPLRACLLLAATHKVPNAQKYAALVESVQKLPVNP